MGLVPGQFRPRVLRAAGRLVQIVVDSWILVALDEERVEARSRARRPLRWQVDVPHQLAVVMVVYIHWPEQLEHGRCALRKDGALDRGHVRGGGRTSGHPRDRQLHRRGLRRRPTGHAAPRHARVLEGNAPTVRGPVAPHPPQQERSAGIRLRGFPSPHARADVQEATGRLRGDWVFSDLGGG
jgi:hypothetical protein